MDRAWRGEDCKLLITGRSCGGGGGGDDANAVFVIPFPAHVQASSLFSLLPFQRTTIDNCHHMSPTSMYLPANSIMLELNLSLVLVFALALRALPQQVTLRLSLARTCSTEKPSPICTHVSFPPPQTARNRLPLVLYAKLARGWIELFCSTLRG